MRRVLWEGWRVPGAPADVTRLHADQTALLSRKQWVTERFCEQDIVTAAGLEVVHIRG